MDPYRQSDTVVVTIWMIWGHTNIGHILPLVDRHIDPVGDIAAKPAVTRARISFSMRVYKAHAAVHSAHGIPRCSRRVALAAQHPNVRRNVAVSVRTDAVQNIVLASNGWETGRARVTNWPTNAVLVHGLDIAVNTDGPQFQSLLHG